MKLKSIVTFTTSLLLISPVADALVQAGRAGLSTSGGSPRSEHSTVDDRNQYSNTNESGCEDPIAKKAISQSFLNTLVDPSVKDEDVIKLKKNSDGSYAVSIGPYLKACTKLQVNLKAHSGNAFVSVINDYPYTKENTGLTDEKLKTMPMELKYEACLKKKGYLKEEGDVKVIDRSNAFANGDIKFGHKSNDEYIPTKGKKSPRIYFGSQLKTEYKPLYPAELESQAPGWKCVVYENLMQKDPVKVFVTERDKIYESALTACETESAEGILNELASLKKHSAGNFQELEKILKEAFYEARKKNLDEIYEDLEKIENDFKKGNFSDEDVKEYKEKLRTLHKIVVAPNVEEIERLLKLRTRKNRDTIDPKIDKLNKQIGKYVDRSGFDIKGILADVAKKGDQEDLKTIADFYLASETYSCIREKSDPNCGKTYDSLKDANKAMKKKRKKVMQDVEFYANQGSSLQGDKRPREKAAKEIKRVKARMDADYRAYALKMQKDLPSSCTAWVKTNWTVQKCNEWKKDQEKRYLAKRKRDLLKLRTLAGEFSTYDELYKKGKDSDGDGEEDSDGERTDPFRFYSRSDDDYSLSDRTSSSSSDFSSYYDLTRSPASSTGMIWGPGTQTNQQGASSSMPMTMPVQPMNYWNQGNPYSGAYMPQQMIGPGMNYNYSTPFMRGY